MELFQIYFTHFVFLIELACFTIFVMCCLTEQYFVFFIFPHPHCCHWRDLVYSVLPPISWTSTPSPLSLSSPCSRDGSSHPEQFPISFVHAGSSKPPVQLVHTVLPGVSLNFAFAGGNDRQYSVMLHVRVCCLV